MNYHNITYPDILNGDGLRVVLWLSGCSHHCNGCQNPQTWSTDSGIPFDEKAEEELFRELSKDYILGITFTGGDPLHENNLREVLRLVNKIRDLFPEKSVWLYTGYTAEELHMFNEIPFPLQSDWENQIFRKEILKNIDVLIDGRYIDSLRDVSLHWKGSSNQRVIDVRQSLQKGGIVLWDTN